METGNNSGLDGVNSMYIRAGYAGAGWSNWAKVFHSGDVATSASINAGIGNEQAVTPDRSVGVTYTNTIGKPITLSLVYTYGNTGYVSVKIDSLTVIPSMKSYFGAGTYDTQLSLIIPNGSTYQIDSNAPSALRTIMELRT